MATEKEKTKNKKTTTSKTNRNIGESSTGTDTSGKEGTVSRSKAETDQKNPQFESERESRRTGPSTGGYGDQHDPKRYEEPQNHQFDRDRERTGYWNEERFSDYDRGFREGAEYAARRYNQENWNRERRGNWGQEGNMGYENEPRYSRYSGYERTEPGYGGSRSYPYNNYGDADRGTNRSYPSMQSGYGDRNPYRFDVRDEFESERGRSRPYGEESYNRDRGEERHYKGNEYGSPYERDRYENRQPNRGTSRYDRERHLKNEPMERERGDRDREW
ncbi:MAG: hypothetical protein ACNS60_13755 [Candidatus Cyclobacteriaceae bacterium M2_1C_046]